MTQLGKLSCEPLFAVLGYQHYAKTMSNSGRQVGSEVVIQV
jgi:hypothetical protein